MNLKIRPLSYALGAEILGLDFQALDAGTFQKVRQAFLDHQVLLFRGQQLTGAQHIAFTRWFGDVDSNPHAAARFLHPEHQEILLIFNPRTKGTPADTYVAEHWHTDRSHTTNPATVSLLRAVDIPEVGGDTEFANMYLAYETLSAGMKTLLDGLDAIHAVESVNRKERGVASPPIAQPVVRVHPETGRKALYLTEKVQQFVGMTVEESEPLLRFLLGHATRPQFCYRHVWQKDDLLVWDNRCLMHNALGDYDKTRNRDMERTAVVGSPSGYVLQQS